MPQTRSHSQEAQMCLNSKITISTHHHLPWPSQTPTQMTLDTNHPQLLKNSPSLILQATTSSCSWDSLSGLSFQSLRQSPSHLSAPYLRQSPQRALLLGFLPSQGEFNPPHVYNYSFADDSKFLFLALTCLFNCKIPLAIARPNPYILSVSSCPHPN